ncbi:ParA family protein [Niveibacterium umoris]|uniref:Chromosome partitioning protein n=1 Tax=Niveibacterium umoris TaxID=1193620 RepID=A0A840BSS4_9RHOO|nr:ParA family protein [Niveibacterium umoris]MBB4014459.1 chromosome partitioning protein [Niveibacterium umoris]
MRVIMVANPKGGVGKSTLSTNLAGHLAWRGASDASTRVMLGDVDRQQSARMWLSLRPVGLPRIAGWDLEPGQPARPPKGTTHAVIDTPAGLHGDKLRGLVKLAHAVIVPLQPSIFDILATRAFLQTLAELKAAKGVQVAVIAMRIDPRTRSAEQLERFTDGLGLPVLAHLRDTQNYVQLAAHGLTLYDVPETRVAKDRQQWLPIERWLRLLEA